MGIVYLILGAFVFWSLIAFVSLLLWLLFWRWNSENYTWLYQVYDYIMCLYKYPQLDLDMKRFLYDNWVDQERVKAKWLHKIIIDKLKRDLNK